MGCLSCPALLPACRASGFHQRGKHRWLMNLSKEPDQSKLQPLNCSQVPFPVSLCLLQQAGHTGLPGSAKQRLLKREGRGYTASAKPCTCWAPATHRGGPAQAPLFAMSADLVATWLSVQHGPGPLQTHKVVRHNIACMTHGQHGGTGETQASEHSYLGQCEAGEAPGSVGCKQELPAAGSC